MKKTTLLLTTIVFITANTGMVQGGLFDNIGKKLRKTGRKIGVETDKASKNARVTGREIGVATDKASKNARVTGREIGVATDKVTNPDQEASPKGQQKDKPSGFVDYVVSNHKYKVNKEDDNWEVTFGQRTHVRHYTGERITPCTLYWKQPDNKITTVKKGQWLELQLKDGTWVGMTAADHRN